MMTDHAEEQEMEAEALGAIFDTHFVVVENVTTNNKQWMITIYPEQSSSDEDELRELNHVCIRLEVELPARYPEEEAPKLKIRIVRGLCEDPHGVELSKLARDEAEANLGAPSIFAVAERLREWLLDHNEPGLDDTSAYASMMRKEQAQKEQEQKKAKASAYESQKTKEEYTEAELEELTVRKRRAEGTPCDRENFEAWSRKFEAERKLAAAEKLSGGEDGAAAGGEDDEAKILRPQPANVGGATKKMTGYEYFAGRGTNLEALEAAAERAEEESEEEDDSDSDESDDDDVPEVANQDLFEEDVDLDDLDFDDDDDDDEDPDI